jgi:YD repeat-containing protein
MFRNRPIKITDADGSVRRQEWNGNGDLVATIDAAGARTEYRYHPNGAAAETIDAADHIRGRYVCARPGRRNGDGRTRR